MNTQVLTCRAKIDPWDAEHIAKCYPQAFTLIDDLGGVIEVHDLEAAYGIYDHRVHVIDDERGFMLRVYDLTWPLIKA